MLRGCCYAANVFTFIRCQCLEAVAADHLNELTAKVLDIAVVHHVSFRASRKVDDSHDAAILARYVAVNKYWMETVFYSFSQLIDISILGPASYIDFSILGYSLMTGYTNRDAMF